MNKELYVSSTPHETKVALLEDDQLAEIYFERANEYTLAGSIYKGRVTRVLPGMQSAFVDIGLERDAFLYVSDFLDLQEEEDEEFDNVKVTGQSVAKANGFVVEKPEAAATGEEGDEESEEGEAPEGGEQSAAGQQEDEGGARRWRGRRRRRGRRGGRDRNTGPNGEPAANGQAEASVDENGSPEEGGEEFVEEPEAGEEQIEVSEHASSHGEASEMEARPAHTEAPAHDAVLLPGETRAPRQPRAEGSESERRDHERREGRESRGSRFDDRRGGRERRGGRGGGGRFRDRDRDRDRGGRDRDREPRTREPEAPLPSNYTPVLLPGESLSKYRGAPAAHAPVETPTHEATETREHSYERHVSHEHEHEPTEASAEVRERPAIAPFRADTKSPEVADERQRLHDMNVASVFGGEEVEEEELVEDTQEEAEELHEAATHAAQEEENGAPAVQEWKRRERAPQHSHEAEEVAKHAEGSYLPEGEGNVVHEELDEEESDMLSASDHYHMHDLDHDSHEQDFASRLGAAAGMLGEAVRETDEEHAIERDEYEFNGGDEFEESEMLAGTDVELEGEAAEAVDEMEGEEPEEGEAVEGGEGEADGRPQRRERRPGRDRFRRGGRSSGGGGGRFGRGGRPHRQARVIPLISDVLKEGQEILVQIAKEPIGKKGARITSHIALPGRFLVYMPTVNHIGVSRKINSDEERQRLKRIVASERENGHGGFIVRTAAAHINEDDLRADIRFLKHLWHEIRTRSENSKSPALIYHDLNLVERILRDQVTQDFSQIWVDSESEYERVVRFASRFQPNLVKRIKLYTKDTPLYEQFGIQEEINKSLKSKVWLKSGGYIVINQTEALVAIDINTGKYVGKTQRLEDTIVKTNVDAVKEIVRQIRVRDLGGIIVIDFIDMDERRNRQKVMQALEEALKADRAPSKVLQFNDFGLVAITRKRVKQSLERTLGSPCPYCASTGFVKSVTTVCNEIWVEMRKVRNHIESQEVTLRVNPDVAKELKADKGKWLIEMEEMIGRPILLKGDASVHQEQFDINF